MFLSSNYIKFKKQYWLVCFLLPVSVICRCWHLEVEVDRLWTSPVLAVAGPAVHVIQEVVFVRVYLNESTQGAARQDRTG